MSSIKRRDRGNLALGMDRSIDMRELNSGLGVFFTFGAPKCFDGRVYSPSGRLKLEALFEGLIISLLSL